MFFVAGWPLDGWLLAATVWVAAEGFAWLLTRLAHDDLHLAAAMRGIGTSFRAIAVGIPLVAVTVADERVGIAPCFLHALALQRRAAASLATYFGSEART